MMVVDVWVLGLDSIWQVAMVILTALAAVFAGPFRVREVGGISKAL